MLNIRIISWFLGGLVTLVAVLAWGSNLSWSITGSNMYIFFPLLGILAFSFMWTHYLINALASWKGWEKDEYYSKITTYLVFVALLLHPGLFFIQLYLDGFGLPPESYIEFLGETLAKFAALGTAAWLAFMAYEFKGWLEQRKLLWKTILIANAAAMFMIFFHGLKLGSNLQTGWFQYVWYFYGITLACSYIYLLVKKKLF